MASGSAGSGCGRNCLQIAPISAFATSARVRFQVRSGTGLSVDEFVRRYQAGALDESVPDVSDLAGLLWLGQNGHRAAA
jgi:hypothetical protein